MKKFKLANAREHMHKVLPYILLIIFLVFLLFPFYWMIITSIKSNRELYDLSANPLLIRQGVTFAHYQYLFGRTLFLRWFGNTILVSSLVTLVSGVISALAAYSTVRLRYKGKTIFTVMVFVAYLVPPALLFIPLYQILRILHLIDSMWGLVVIYPTFTVPFCIWLLLGYFKTIPRELEESAIVDGASRLQALIHIVVPVALPGLVTTILFSFTLSWSQFLYAVTFVNSSSQKVLSAGVVSELVRGDVFYWGSLMAGALLTSLPVVVVYAFFTRYFVSGLTAGATKY